MRVARLYAGDQLTFQSQADQDPPNDQDFGTNPSADPVAEALAVFGLQQLEEPKRARPGVAGRDRKFYLWTCHEAVFQLWCDVQTQWRYRSAGMGGAVPCGLDYAGVDAARRGLGISRAAYADMFPALQIMERAAINVFTEKFDAQAAS